MPDCLTYFSKKIFFLLLLFFKISTTLAQTEYLVKVDPSNGSYSKVDSIPGVTFILLFDAVAIDKVNSHFTFIGSKDQVNWKLFTLNEDDGSIIYNPSLINGNSIIALAYSTPGTLYGLVANAGIFSIGIFNIQTGAFSKIADTQIEAAQMVIDDKDHYIFLSGSLNGNFVLATFDMATGNVVTQVPFSNVTNLVYDNLANKLYGVAYNTNNSGNTIKSLVTVDPATGKVATVADLPGEINGVYQGEQTFNENAQTYILAALDVNGVSSLYSIDANKGNVIYQVPESMTNDYNKDNVIMYRYDNNLQQLYALHWEAKKINPVDTDSSCTVNLQIKLYPNPFGNKLMIQKNVTTCNIRMNLFNAIGQLILVGKVISDGTNQIQLNNIAKGAYFYEFYSETKIVLTGKIIQQ